MAEPSLPLGLSELFKFLYYVEDVSRNLKNSLRNSCELLGWFIYVVNVAIKAQMSNVFPVNVCEWILTLLRMKDGFFDSGFGAILASGLDVVFRMPSDSTGSPEMMRYTELQN